MGLVDHPVADGRQQASIGGQVAEQQAVVRHHHVGFFRAPTRAMHEARRPEVRALAAQAVMACRGDGTAGQHAVVDLKAVHVVVFRLLDERKQGCQGGSLGVFLARHFAHAGAFGHQAVDAAQAGVVREALQRGIRQSAERLRRARQLVVDQLVQQGVRLGRHAHGDVVGARDQGGRHQVGHGLAHARARFHHEVLGGGEGGTHGLGHDGLLHAWLEVRVQAPTRPVSSKAWATSSAAGNVSPRSGSAARTSASGFGLCSMAPTRSLRSARNENGRSSGKSPASSGSPAAIASVVLLAASEDASDDAPKSHRRLAVSAKYSNTTWRLAIALVAPCGRSRARAAPAWRATAASRMRNRLHVAATSASARCVGRR